MSIVVAVAGGTGAIGRPIVEAMKKDGRYDILVLSRRVNAEFEKDVGVKMYATDYSDPTWLVRFLEENNVDTLISTVGVESGPANELNLIEAAERSRVTKRTIPNLWSMTPYQEKHVKTNPIAGVMLNVISQLQKTHLEWAAIRPGLFLDYYVQGLPSKMTYSGMLVDVRNNIAGIPGKGDTPVPMTYSRDIGKYVAALLGIPKWEQYYYIQGDTPTLNQVVAQAERAKGVRFDVSYDEVEALKRGEVTVLPGYLAVAEGLGGGEVGIKTVRALMAENAICIEEGDVEYPGPFLNEMFPEIKPLTIEEGWRFVAENEEAGV